MDSSNVLDIFLKKCRIKDTGKPFTHTRIPDAGLSIYGGSFHISDEEYKTFSKIYYNHVILGHNSEYLTEKQRMEDGPVMIDIDFKYDIKIKTRQHSRDHINDLVHLYITELNKMLVIPLHTTIEVYVMERVNVTMLPDKNKTKDGIHIIIGLKLHKNLQIILRETIIPKISEMWKDLPLTNTFNDVFDEGVTRGTVNWQLYGSTKPGCTPYVLTYIIECITREDDTFDIEFLPVEHLSIANNLHKLSARYTGYQSFESRIKYDNTNALTAMHHSNTISNGVKKLKIVTNKNTNIIKNEAHLHTLLGELFEGDIKNKELYDYTMALPEKYYGSGSYVKWYNVGIALKNEGDKNFPIFAAFSSRVICRDTLKGSDGKFNWNDGITECYKMWSGIPDRLTGSDCLTRKSIIWWCKNDNPEQWNEIRKTNTDSYVKSSIEQNTNDFDIALVVYSLYKGQYVCTNLKSFIWYEFREHRWHEIDSAVTLRIKLSTEVYKIYMDTLEDLNNRLQTMSATDNMRDELIKQVKRTTEIAGMLKKTNHKKNILAEASLKFFDKDFSDKIDKNPYLLSFKNGVVDFKLRKFRPGHPDDYITKCTNIDYISPSNEPTTGDAVNVDIKEYNRISDEIDLFMDQVFPDPTIRKYMNDYHSSCLIGKNTNQKFHIYKGTGRNGKSALISLMSKSMGDYKSVVPISLVTSKRGTIGGTSSEVSKLNGVRFAVMQEPTKGDKINEGIVKELTGGTDPIIVRELYKPSMSFIPMFKLVVTTNVEFEITTNDDGTWRRIVYVPFSSVFLENPYTNEKFNKAEYPHQYILDKKIEDKFESWATVFMYKLVNFQFNKSDDNIGVVAECKSVEVNSDIHRNGQDYLSGYVSDRIGKSIGGVIKKQAVYDDFKAWYTSNYGKMVPKGRELYEFMNVRYGLYKNGWKDICIIEEDAAIE